MPIAKGDLPGVRQLVDGEHAAVELEEEPVVEFIDDGFRGALQISEVPDPGVGGQIAFEFDDHLVVVAVEWFAIAEEGGHVGGGKAEAVSFDGDPARDFHAHNPTGSRPFALPQFVTFATIGVARLAPKDVHVALVIVTSGAPGEGKTGVAAAIARHYAYLGKATQLVRLPGDDKESATADAAFFGSLAFVPGSASSVSTAGDVRDPGGDAVTVVEANLDAAASLQGSVVLVVRGAVPTTLPAGLSPKAVVVTDVAASAMPSGPASINGVPVIVLGEDRSLAGFSVEEARQAIDAEVLVPGDGLESTCDYLVVAPISSDAGQPYFRRFQSKAVVVRFDKTDQHLAAMRAAPECLILTGGQRPSGYVYDAAAANGLPVLLSRTDTENTVIALEGIFDHTRFQGERKLDRMAALVEASALFGAL